MKKFTLGALIPTAPYANKNVEVTLDFEDDVKTADCWLKVDEALNFKIDMINKEMEMDANFGTTKKEPVTPATPAPSTTPPAPAVNTQPATQLCDIHGVQMKGRDGQYGWFYSHKDGQAWCNGKPKARYTA